MHICRYKYIYIHYSDYTVYVRVVLIIKLSYYFYKYMIVYLFQKMRSTTFTKEFEGLNLEGARDNPSTRKLFYSKDQIT